MTEILRTALYHLVEGRHGRFLANPRDIYLGRSMIAYGEFSELEWRLLDQMIRPGAFIVEAGANMGAFTVPMARKVGHGGLVFAFEPQIVIFQQLCANLALNDIVNVQAFNAGCGNEAGWIDILRPNPEVEANFGGIRLDQIKGQGGNRVRIERLDDALDPPRLNLIKADVEGMEHAVISGAQDLIRKHRPLLYLEAHEPEHAPALIRLVRSLDYDLYWHLPPMFNPDNYAGNKQNIFSRITSKNMLGVPSEAKATITGGRPVAGEDDHPRNWE